MKYRHLNKWIKQLPTPAKALVIIGLIILTIVFSLIVMFMMHRKLKKINMIDALKSNE